MKISCDLSSMIRVMCGICMMTAMPTFAEEEMVPPSDVVLTEEVVNNDSEKQPAGEDLVADEDRPSIDHIEGFAVYPPKATKKQGPQAFFGSYPQSTVIYNPHPGLYHAVKLFINYGEGVVLEDGSEWAVEPAGALEIQTWFSTDVVFIVPNANGYTNPYYYFRLYNQTKDVSVAVQLRLFVIPPYHSVYNHQVCGYDDFQCMIWLEDGSVWSVYPGDYSQMWALGHTILIGVNNGDLSSTRPYILINADRNKYVRAECIRR